MSELDKELKAKTSMLKNAIASVNTTTESSLDDQLNAVSDLKSDMTEIKKDIHGLTRRVDSMTSVVEKLSKAVLSMAKPLEEDNSIPSENADNHEELEDSGESEIIDDKTE